MLKNQKFGRTAERKKKEQNSYHGSIYDSLLLRGLIVLLCLIILTSALYSIYGYGHKGAESRSGTDNENPLAGSIRGPCTMTTTDHTIKCSNIPENTSEIVASYINENSNEWPTDPEYTLHIENCIFRRNTLSMGWLPALNTTIIISQLHVKTSEPITIEENAFSDNNFQNITLLKLEGSIAQLNKKCFAGLRRLDTLEIDEGPIQSVAGGILSDVQNLSTLQIESKISDDHLSHFLHNITLHSLQELHIRYNNFKNLKSENFRGLTNLLTLNAESSHITSIESAILESSAHKIQQVIFSNNELETLPVDIFNIKSARSNFAVYLQQNKLKTLPKGIFDMAINSRGRVEVRLENNNWHCDCDLAWLRNYIEEEKIYVGDQPICESPEINKNKSLGDADFSDCDITTLPSVSSTTTTEATTSSTTETVTSETTTPSTTETTADSATSTTKTTFGTTTSSTQVTDDTTTPSPGVGHTTLRCNCTNCNTEHMHIVTDSSSGISPLTMRGIKSLTIKENEVTGEITATIDAKSKHVLIWMDNNKDYNCTELSEQKERSLKSTTFETARNTSYAICAALISDEKIIVTPQNCIAHKTLPSQEDRPLLLIEDKEITLAISCSALVVTMIISGAICYKVVLHNPKLLKGNKRVIIVQRHEYADGLPPLDENDSRRSSQTTYTTESSGEATYMTSHEPTTVEEFACMYDTPSDCKTESAIVFFSGQEPPPLPLCNTSYTSDTSCNREPNSETDYVPSSESA